MKNLCFILLLLFSCSDVPEDHFIFDDTFRPNAIGTVTWTVKPKSAISDFDIVVYSPADDTVFVSQSVSEGWNGMRDGVLQPPGTYRFVIHYSYPCPVCDVVANPDNPDIYNNWTSGTLKGRFDLFY